MKRSPTGARSRLFVEVPIMSAPPPIRLSLLDLAPVSSFSLLANRRRLAGFSIGGSRGTQEMLDYCAEQNTTSDVEVMPIERIEEAYERTVKGDVRYRFVIDMKTL